MKKTIFFFLVFTGISLAKAQPAIQWQKCLGGLAGDYAEAIQETTDGGFIVGGFSLSNDGDVSGNHGHEDFFWVVKLNSTGTIQWQKSLGGSGIENAYAIQQTTDGGYIVAGYAASNDGDVSGNHGGDDYWVVKLSSTGTIEWQKCLGGTAMDDALFITQTADGGYIVSGDTKSVDGDVTGNHGGYDAWIVKLSSLGAIEWQKCLGGPGDESASVIQSTADGGYIVLGSTMGSAGGDVSGNHGDWDYWIVKLNNTGSIQWQKCVGGSAQDVGYAIQQTTDGSFVVAGFTKSNDGDVNGIHGSGAQPDYLVLKLSSTGTLQWQKCFGGVSDEKAYSIRVTDDGGCIVAGYAKSNGGDVSGNHGSVIHDYWLIKLDGAGSIQWQKCLGGPGIDWARSIKQTTDYGYIIAGFTESNTGDVTANHGNNDYWIVKLHPYITGIEEYSSPAWQIFPNPSAGAFSINGNMPVGNTELKILNPLGQLVYKCHLSQEKTNVDLSAYPAGIYFATISGENYKWMGKIIIE